MHGRTRTTAQRNGGSATSTNGVKNDSVVKVQRRPKDAQQVMLNGPTHDGQLPDGLGPMLSPAPGFPGSRLDARTVTALGEHANVHAASPINTPQVREAALTHGLARIAHLAKGCDCPFRALPRSRDHPLQALLQRNPNHQFSKASCRRQYSYVCLCALLPHYIRRHSFTQPPPKFAHLAEGYGCLGHGHGRRHPRGRQQPAARHQAHQQQAAHQVAGVGPEPVLHQVLG